MIASNGYFENEWAILVSFHNSCNLSITLTDRNLRIIYHIDFVVDLS